MKKPSAKWLEFGKLIRIIDIKVSKEERLYKKLKDKELEFIDALNLYWSEIEVYQNLLKNLEPKEELSSLTRHFLRKENIKSEIESLYFDASRCLNDLESTKKERQDSELRKNKLERRKEALLQVQKDLF